MFLKTLKHDLKNSYKDYALLYTTMLIFAVLAPLGARSNIGLLNFVITLMFLFIVFGSMVMVVTNTIKFLRRRLFDQGAYFNLTLPVKTEVTILSKILTVNIWIYATFIFMLISFGVVALTFSNFDLSIFGFLKETIDWLLQHVNVVDLTLYLLLMFMSSLTLSATIVLSMTIVNTSWVKRNNYFFAVLFFFLVATIRSWIDAGFDYLVLGNLSHSMGPHMMNQTGYSMMFSNMEVLNDPLVTGVYLVYELLWFIVIFYGIKYLFTKKLEI